MGETQDYDDDPPMMCPVSKQQCVRAFCDDYGCATEANVPLDEYDFASGSINPDEQVIPLPRTVRKRRANLTKAPG